MMYKIIYKIVTRGKNTLAYFCLKLQINKVYDNCVTETNTDRNKHSSLFFLKLQIKKVCDIGVTGTKTIPYLFSQK